MKTPTVKIAHKDGYSVINECDFDAKKHKLFTETGAPNLSRDGIKKMDRPEVVAALVSHGLSEADVEGVKLPDLRKTLISVVFVGD